MIEEYEAFTPEQLAILKRYVSNTDSNIFVLKNLPEVIKGAMFSKYSRSKLGLRSLLMKEFMGESAAAFDNITANASETGSTDEIEKQTDAIKRAQDFYDRILDGYGDDSIGELGGAHLAMERVSMLAAKVIEDCRIGGSPLEKSTRYINFDQKENGEYLFLREPILMTSAYKDDYINICNKLFDTYNELIAPLTTHIKKNFPCPEDMNERAYNASLRAKVFDCLRGLLPASTLTSLGIFGNGRFFETFIQKMQCHPLLEMQEIGKKSHEELAKVIPSFVRRAENNHRHFIPFKRFTDEMLSELKVLSRQYASNIETPRTKSPEVKLVDFDEQAPTKVAATLLFANADKGLHELEAICSQMTDEELDRIFDAASSYRENRRHKSPRALERAFFTFEIVADFGAYRDLQRHRTLSQERQWLNCDLGFYTPKEVIECGVEREYKQVLQEAKQVYDKIAMELPEEAQYVVPMAYNIRWYFHINLRALQWLCELRSSPAGHPNYRYIAQEMAKQVGERFPQFKRFFKYVDYEGHELGRLQQEQRKEEKVALLNN